MGRFWAGHQGGWTFAGAGRATPRHMHARATRGWNGPLRRGCHCRPACGLQLHRGQHAVPGPHSYSGL
ncbi:hypothetical protein QJS66_19015 [Kocuria rhizophila]|nr:hypothetical protein QJS66_19015 [Kocuria rhizophila]